MSRRPDYSADDMIYALRLVRLGRPRHEVLRALTVLPSGRRDPGSWKYVRVMAERGKEAADAYAERTVDKAFRFAAENAAIKDRSDAIMRLLEIEAAAGRMPWGIYAGPSVRRTLEAAFLIGDRTGGIRFGLSLRQWSTIAGQDFETIRANRNALVNLGWLRRNPDDKNGRTARYTLRIPPHIQHTGHENVGDASDRTWLPHDAFRPAALDDAAWYVLTTIRRPMTVDLSAAATGFDTGHLLDIASRLEAFALVDVSDSSIERVADPLPGLDAAAAELGSHGQGRADAERFTADRAAWKQRAKERGLVNVGKSS